MNTDTLEAAAKRIIGNAKVPSILPITLETNIYSKTKNEDLTYTGDDELVWDRVNAERLRRGLPSLTAIGYPRPETAA